MLEVFDNFISNTLLGTGKTCFHICEHVTFNLHIKIIYEEQFPSPCQETLSLFFPRPVNIHILDFRYIDDLRAYSECGNIIS